MKKLTLSLALLLCCLVSLAQLPLNEFLGIPFGSSRAQAEKILASRGYTIDSQYSKPDQITLTSGTFAGRKIDLIGLSFVDDRLYYTGVIFSCDLESQLIPLYNDLKDLITKKYTLPVSEREEYKYPYKAGDGFTESAIKTGNAIFETTWKFSDKETTVPNRIQLSISHRMLVNLVYYDGALTRISASQTNEQNSRDL